MQGERRLQLPFVLTKQQKQFAKNKNINSMKIRFFCLVIVLAGMISGGIFMQSCSSETEYAGLTDISGSKFALFEKEFINNLSSNKNIIKLAGFRTYNISEDEKEDFKKLLSEYGEEMKKMNLVVADDYSYFRVYFPLHTAIVEYEGKTYTADGKGLVYIPQLKDISKMKVIGRKKSETVHGTGSNIIEKDKILLKKPFEQRTHDGVRLGYSIDGNACIFDLESLTGMNHSCCTKTLSCGAPRLKSGSESEEQDEYDNKVSCMQNHGGPNCTIAFGIYQGRCPLNTSTCMDYNGWINETGVSTCNDHSSLAGFPGSDCSVAIARGECWNEVR
jgi:hypothetical protein